MPTAVELLANILSKAFSLNVGDGSVFEGSIDKFDAGLNALETAKSGEFGAGERRYAGVFNQLGGEEFLVGAHFQTDAQLFNQIFTHADFGQGGGSGRPSAYGEGGGAGTQADIALFDRQLSGTGVDLEKFGVDLARLGAVNSHEALTAAESRLHPDLQHLQHDFAALSSGASALVHDLAGFGEGGGSGFSAFAAALSPLTDEFAKIGADFAKLDRMFGEGGGSGTVAFGEGGGAGMPYGAAFGALNEHFAALDGTLQGLGGPVANLLLPAVQRAG